MCKILLSINPEHVDNIFNGNKKYEFRKTVNKQVVDKIIIYCTSPIMRIVGEIEVVNTVVSTPEIVWNIAKSSAGITKEYYNNYYKNKNTAVAYELGKVRKYDNPRKLDYYGLKNAPQSFCYL